jgi:tRNA wybutosine-synthesizing protein 1
MVTDKQEKQLQKASYRVFGKNKHSAVKLCLWTRRSIKTGEADFCYKQKFYRSICGVTAHRCIQMTPVFTKCNLRCSHCWRNHEYFSKVEHDWDSPEEIFTESIKAQQALLTGLGGVPHSEEHLKEANEPNQVAISLDGEPFCYPYLDELIELYRKNNFSVFLVTNGTFPKEIKNLKHLPTNFYLSLTSNTKEMFNKTQHPLTPDLWNNVLESLKLFSQLKTIRVIRVTCVKDMNMTEPEKYAELIRLAQPDYIEVKAWVAVGGSTKRLKYEQMPRHEEVDNFSKEILKYLKNYSKVDEKKNSRVILLKRKSS